jgi:hypothetical protein
MASFLIQTASSKFKLKSWTNQEVTCRYRPPAPMAIGTAIGINWVGPSVGGTDRPGWSVQLHVTRAASSPLPGSTDSTSVDSDPAPVGISDH